MVNFDYNLETSDIEGFDPLRVLEIAIMQCLVLSIQKIVDNSKMKNLKVRISNNMVRIIAECDNGVENDVFKAINTCYISNNVIFQKTIKINGMQK